MRGNYIKMQHFARDNNHLDCRHLAYKLERNKRYHYRVNECG